MVFLENRVGNIQRSHVVDRTAAPVPDIFLKGRAGHIQRSSIVDTAALVEPVGCSCELCTGIVRKVGIHHIHSPGIIDP